MWDGRGDKQRCTVSGDFLLALCYIAEGYLRGLFTDIVCFSTAISLLDASQIITATTSLQQYQQPQLCFDIIKDIEKELEENIKIIVIKWLSRVKRQKRTQCNVAT